MKLSRAGLDKPDILGQAWNGSYSRHNTLGLERVGSGRFGSGQIQLDPTWYDVEIKGGNLASNPVNQIWMELGSNHIFTLKYGLKFMIFIL